MKKQYIFSALLAASLGSVIVASEMPDPKRWHECGKQLADGYSITAPDAQGTGKIIKNNETVATYKALHPMVCVDRDGNQESSVTVDITCKGSHYTGLLILDKDGKTYQMRPDIGSNKGFDAMPITEIKKYVNPYQQAPHNKILSENETALYTFFDSKSGKIVQITASALLLYGTGRVIWDTRHYWKKLGKLIPALPRKKVGKKRKHA